MTQHPKDDYGSGQVQKWNRTEHNWFQNQAHDYDTAADGTLMAYMREAPVFKSMNNFTRNIGNGNYFSAFSDAKNTFTDAEKIVDSYGFADDGNKSKFPGKGKFM